MGISSDFLFVMALSVAFHIGYYKSI